MEAKTKILTTLQEKWILSVPKISQYSNCNDIDIYRSIADLLEENKIQEIVKGKRKTSCFKAL